MNLSFIRTKKFRILTAIIFVGALLFILYNVFFTSPYYVFAKHDKWQAQETDCEITLKASYKAKRSGYYYGEKFENNIIGKIVINENEYHFGVQIRPEFDSFDFGNTDFRSDLSKLYAEEPYWEIHGYINISPIDALTTDSFKIKIIDNVGDVFPDNIKELTFVHAD